MNRTLPNEMRVQCITKLSNQKAPFATFDIFMGFEMYYNYCTTYHKTKDFAEELHAINTSIFFNSGLGT